MLAVVINADQALNMLSQGALLFILASGLAVIFGLMNIINFAHGSLIMVGAYAGAEVAAHHLSSWLAIPIGFAVGVALGFVVEVVLIRRLYGRPWDTILATIGLGLILIAVVSIVFGRENKYVGTPLSGEWNLGFDRYSSYRLFLVIFAAALFASLWFVTNKTRLGLVARAVIANETLAATHGIDSRAVRRWTFMVGAGLAGVAGALVAPIGSVQPNMGQDYLVDAFMVVMVAYSSVGGLLLAALLFGAAESWVTFLTTPIVGSVTIIVLTAITLRVLPQGFSALALPGRDGALRPRSGRDLPTPPEDAVR
ncbi:MAG TPA: hypothetical protein VFA88_03585 [Gaiellaceae bacterium]|nr:hypothetical protein [Gaiellaceae bacterium]